jgi:L-threonylcarbamoyladenylate synthase
MARYERIAVSAGAANLDPTVRRAVTVLEAGGVLGHPTDTVYGIGGAVRPEVDQRVAALKGRALDRSPLLRIALDADVLRRSFPDLEWNVWAKQLASRFWPGPLTLVLADSSGKGVAVRVEGHPVMRAVLKAWKGPIGSSSLNVSGEPPAATAGQAARYLAMMPDVDVPVLLLDAGHLAGTPASTLVSLLTPMPTVLREGAVPREAIEDCLEGTIRP